MKARLVGNLSKAAVLSLAMLLLLAGGCAPGILVPTPTLAPQALTSPSDLPSLSTVVRKVLPSVVYIFMESDPSSRLAGASASGSGVIMRSDGYILTNKHVVEGAKRIEVTLQNDAVYNVSDVWTDDVMDLAVVKIEGNRFPAAQFGDTAGVQVGDWVIAIGHALGLSPKQGGPTVTSGIVSNLGRSFWIDQTPYYDLIQTDAAINPGNSGGPLVNLRGEVIGVNSANTAGQNIGYAINVATARHCFEDLVQYGKAHHPYMGVDVNDATPAMASRMGLSQRVGAVITTIQDSGPAGLSGLKTGDVIVRFGQTDIRSSTDLLRQLWRQEVGDTLTLVVRRGTQVTEKIVVLEQRPENASTM